MLVKILLMDLLWRTLAVHIFCIHDPSAATINDTTEADLEKEEKK